VLIVQVDVHACYSSRHIQSLSQTMVNHYKQHIAVLRARYQVLIEEQEQSGQPIDGLLIHSGSENFHYADDQASPFRAYGHFCHWLPINRPDQMLLISPGKNPVYFQVIPSDYWFDQSIENASWWCDEFEIVTLTATNQIAHYLDNSGRVAFLGENTTFARELGLDQRLVNPSALIHNLDFHRAYKSNYEIEQIRAANTEAFIGHNAAKNCFENDGSEYDIHMSFLQACNILEEDSPYTNIVALNEKSAILHYQHKLRRREQDSSEKSQVLLIDAGCRVNNYCSDITRTSTRSHTHAVFQSLVIEMEELQLNLVSRVSIGLSYIDFHRTALELLTHTLIKHELINCSIDQALGQSLASLFMPHGIGHLLGIQVHDVGGHYCDAKGGKKLPPEEFPYLRNTRVMEQNMVFTVEPGLYFIPVLLNQERSTPKGKNLNWKLIDELLPLGGIRVEDNVLVRKSSVVNLTRQ